MAFQEGTANDHYHLLELFTTFVTTHPDLVAVGQNWQLLKSETIPSYNLNTTNTDPVYTQDFSVKYLRAPGLSNQDSIYINILCYAANTAQIFNWFISGCIGFDGTKKFEEQPGIQRAAQTQTVADTPCLTLINSQIKYWFIANGRRAIVIAKIGGDFFVSYMGFILPYGKPSEYPYPLLISGTVDNIAIGYTNTQLYNLWNRSGNTLSAALFIDDGHWGALGSGSSTTSLGRVNVAVNPYDKLRGYTESNNLRGNLDGSFTTLACILYSSQSGFIGEFGEFDGIFYIPGVGQADLTTEDTLTIGSDTCLICQNVDKASRNDFAAILLK